jgi:ABC-2 type transport system ATP-binding protein
MIEVTGLTVRYRGVPAVDDLSFRAGPGRVTAFLGRNGAGKTSTLRVLVGLTDPDRGTALVDGRHYRSLRRPLRGVGAVLDAGAVDGARTAAAHLSCLARSNGIGRARVADVLDRVGLADVAGRRVGRLSLGMRQRLGIAAALLGDPPVLVLDEPATGLDPQGIRWIHDLLLELAAAGRTVLVSSHLIGELGRICDRVVVIDRGRLVADTTPGDLVARFDRGVLVRAADRPRLARALRASGATVGDEDGGLVVRGIGAAGIGELACAQRIALCELTPRHLELEEAFLRLTGRPTDAAAGQERS